MRCCVLPAKFYATDERNPTVQGKIKCLSFMAVLGVALRAAEPTEMEIAEQLAAKCGYARIGHDAEGHVTGLQFVTRKAYVEEDEWLGWKVVEVVNKGGKDLPQLTDADLAHLHKLPHLTFLKMDGMMVSGQGYASLKALKQLEYLGLHTIDRKELGVKCDPTCLLVANELPNLRRFDYKHNFKMRNVPVDRLKGTDKLEYLHLDNACCESSVVPFILACPNLTRLELHRTGITAQDLANIVATNKKLTDIRIRPRDNKSVQPDDLALLKQLPALETLCFGGHYNKLKFTTKDLEEIKASKTLKTIVAPVKKKDDPLFKAWADSLEGVEVSFSYY